MTLPLSRDQIAAIQARADMVSCPYCNGHGWTAEVQPVCCRRSEVCCGQPIPEQYQEQCASCGGSGKPPSDIPALCQQALRAIELESEKRAFIAGALQMKNAEHCGGDQWWRGYDMLKQAIIDQNVDCSAPWLREPAASSKASYHDRLESELTAARKALEEERGRKPLGYMVRWNRQPRYDEVRYFEKWSEAMAYLRELEENGWTDPEIIALYERALPAPQVKP